MVSFGNGSLISGVISVPTTLSTSASLGDTVIRSGTGNKLFLQSGSGSAGMYINDYNNVVLDNPTTVLSRSNVSGFSTFYYNVSMNTSLNVNQCTVTNTSNVSGIT